MVQLYRQGHIKPIPPARIFEPNGVQDAFKLMQLGQHIGKIIVELRDPFGYVKLGTEVAGRTKTMNFDSSASYLLVGGLGGFGRSISIWMAEHGARHLTFLSPSAGARIQHTELIQELESMNCSVQLTQGSISNAEDVKKAISSNTNPIKGVLQMSMVLRDQTFSRMSLEDWNATVHPKLQGTWNLHNELESAGAVLDFFVLFSSLSGIIGNPGQANYASASTFLDAFVQYRTSLKLPISAIDIGPVDDIGFVAENASVSRKMRSNGFYGISEQSLLDALTLAIVGGRKHTTSQHQFMDYNSFVLGLHSTIPINDPNNRTIWKNDIRMAAYHNAIPAGSETVASSDTLKSFLAEAKSNPSVLTAPRTSTLLAKEIGKKLFLLLLKSDEELNTNLSLSDLGMDSLVAIEMRTWWKQAFEFDISVLEMLGMGTLNALGKHAADGLARCFQQVVAKANSAA
jgi:acyl carrier protein